MFTSKRKLIMGWEWGGKHGDVNLFYPFFSGVLLNYLLEEVYRFSDLNT